MASLYAKPCVELAKECDGYKSDGLWNMYAERLDECDFFAGCGKKNGQVDYCGIAYCYWLFMNVITDDGEITDDDRKYMTHYAMYQRDDCCTSAGCTQQSDVYKANGAWFTNPQDLERGDQIFFQKSNGAIYHTGMCTGWDDDGAYVTEANVEGRQTLTRFYPYSEFGNKIAGFGKPRFDGWEIETSEDQDEKDDDVITEPDVSADLPKSIDEIAEEVIRGEWGNGRERAERLEKAGYNYHEVQDRVNELLGIGKDSGKRYRVDVNTKLNVRYGAGKNYPIIRQLSDGTEVTVTDERNGWGKIGNNEWVCMDYLQKI